MQPWLRVFRADRTAPEWRGCHCGRGISVWIRGSGIPEVGRLRSRDRSRASRACTRPSSGIRPCWKRRCARIYGNYVFSYRRGVCFLFDLASEFFLSFYPWYPSNPPPPINQLSTTYRSHMRFWIRIEWNQPDCRGFHRQLEPATSHLERLSTGGNNVPPTI